jgi:hypothetical protein
MVRCFVDGRSDLIAIEKCFPGEFAEVKLCAVPDNAPQKAQAHPPIHLSFNELQTRNLPFGLPLGLREMISFLTGINDFRHHLQMNPRGRAFAAGSVHPA